LSAAVTVLGAAHAGAVMLFGRNLGMRDHLATADEVLTMCNGLTERFAHGPVLMPIVVLQADQARDRPSPSPAPDREESAEEASALLVDELHDHYKDRRVLCRRYPNKPDQRYAPLVPESPLPSLTGTLDEYDEALKLVRALATPRDWDNAGRSRYRRYPFPRSALLSAIEEAVAQSASVRGSTPAGQGTSASEITPKAERPDQRAAFKRLNNLYPRKPVSGLVAALSSLMAVLMPFVLIVLSVALTTVSTPQRVPLILSLMALIVLTAWVVLVFRQSLTAPLSAIFPGSRWFATSTFILAKDELDEKSPMHLGPLGALMSRWSRRMRTVREERARMIVSQLSTAYYGSPSVSDPAPSPPAANDAAREIAMQLYLSLRVHALLEDLRASYQPGNLDLRRRKRRLPPMLFLPRVDQRPGCMRFVQAVSDLRSRRSEADPLLILASSREPLTAQPSPEPDDRRHDPYRRWIGRLRVEQSPSLGRRLPWVLLQRVRADWWLSPARHDLPKAGWSVWHLWSRWTVAFAVVLLCIGGLWRNQMIEEQYCNGSLFGYDPNLVLVSGECIGTDTTSAPAFLPAGEGVTLSDTGTAPGAAPADGSPVSLSQVNLAYLEGLISQQNQVATASGSFITVVYAGALTAPAAPAGSPDRVRGALEELAGVYAWQYYVNMLQDDHVKLRIDIANDGDKAAQQRLMAKTVVAAANQDPSIEGVIGLDVDTKQAAAAIQDFAAADLPIIDTTISDDNFPKQDWNYFGLSPTNGEEAQALVSRYAGRGNGKSAVVFQRFGADGKPADPYTQQQALSARKYLAAAGFTLAGENGGADPIPYTTQTTWANSQAILQAVCTSRPSVVYLAGRHEDMTQLVGLLRQQKQCFPPHVTVLSGDDMTETEYPDTNAPALAPEMTLYYVAQTDPAHVPAVPGGVSSADNGSGLNIDLQKALSLDSIPGYSDAVFANGHMALGFDAADLLYSASTTATGAGGQEQALPRAAVAPGLRCPQEPIVSNGAMGPLGFANVKHGLDFFMAVNAASGPNPQHVTFQSYQPTVPGMCAPNVAS
jgi:hypothetical protein